MSDVLSQIYGEAVIQEQELCQVKRVLPCKIAYKILFDSEKSCNNAADWVGPENVKVGILSGERIIACVKLPIDEIDPDFIQFIKVTGGYIKMQVINKDGSDADAVYI